MVLQLELPAVASRRLVQREIVARKFVAHRFDGTIFGPKGTEPAFNLAIEVRVRKSGLRYAVIVDESDSPVISPVTKIKDGSPTNIFDGAPFDAQDGFKLKSGGFINNDFRGRFEKSFTTRQGDSRFTVYSNMVYDIFCDPDEELRLGRFVYTNTFYRNISTHLTHHEPVEVFSRSILISESDLSFKARAVRSVKESAPQYNHTTIRTQADEFVVASSGGHLVTTSASMALLERDYQPFTNSLGLSAEVRTRIDRLKRDEKGVKLISDPSLNLVVLRKLFGLTSLVAPDKQMLLNAITRAVVDSNHFDVNEFFATQ